MTVLESKVLVTGGAGFIGSSLVDSLLAEGAREVVVFDNFVRGTSLNLEQALRSQRLAVIEGDIRDREAIAQAMEGVSYVFHEAALRITRCAEAPREAIEVLVNGTFNVLEAALRTGVKKVIAASSASVYGEPSYLPMDEAHPFNNRTLYGACKIANEQVLRSLHEMRGLNYVALRYFNVYGPRMDIFGAYTEVIPRWLERIDAGQPPIIFGDGLQTMDFVYIDDVVRANLLALESDATDEVFNVASGTETTLNELVQIVLKATGSSISAEYREARKVNAVQRRRGATEKSEKVLGFRATCTLREGIKKLVEWRAMIKKRSVSEILSKFS